MRTPTRTHKGEIIPSTPSQIVRIETAYPVFLMMLIPTFGIVINHFYIFDFLDVIKIILICMFTAGGIELYLWSLPILLNETLGRLD